MVDKLEGVNYSIELKDLSQNKQWNYIIEDDIKLNCSLCSNDMEEGFVCNHKQLLFCIDCNYHKKAARLCDSSCFSCLKKEMQERFHIHTNAKFIFIQNYLKKQ